MYGVSRQTVTRWLADARDVVSAEVHRLLREHLRLSKNDVASLARLVASDLDVSMSRLLATAWFTWRSGRRSPDAAFPSRRLCDAALLFSEWGKEQTEPLLKGCEQPHRR